MKLFNAGNKDYVVKYSINGLIAMEQRLGKSFMSLFDDESGMSLGAIRMLVYCGLMEKQSQLSEEAVGNVIQDAIDEGMSFQEIANVFMTEMTKALGMSKSTEEVETPSKNEQSLLLTTLLHHGQMTYTKQGQESQRFLPHFFIAQNLEKFYWLQRVMRLTSVSSSICNRQQ